MLLVLATVGAVAALGLVSLGPVAVGPALIAGAALSASATARRSRFGLLAGAGLVFLYVAYVQRQGAGDHLLAHGNRHRMQPAAPADP